MHVGVYAKCEFEKVKTKSKVYGCPDHRNKFLIEHASYCYMCGKPLISFEETYEAYPVADHEPTIYPLETRLIEDKLYVVSSDNDDSTYFDEYTIEELRLDFSVMVDALVKFNSLYKEQLYWLSQYGKIEVHFGILNTDG
jgi:hypothetical protein